MSRPYVNVCWTAGCDRERATGLTRCGPCNSAFEAGVETGRTTVLP